MKAFEAYNPMVIALYFLAVSGIAMFCMNPILLLLSLVGALLLFFSYNGRRDARSHLACVGLFFLVALINPLVSHNGATVLFVLNDAPVTVEALLYGLTAGTMVLAVLYWFRSFTRIMTGDKLLYLFGRLSPTLSLVLSMALRYVPLFRRQTRKIRQAQTALGLYKEDNVVDRFRGGLRIFSVMMTWALENGIVTADSMTARGYGQGRRSHFSIFRFGGADWALLLMTLVLFGLTCVSIGFGALDVTFYPTFAVAEVTSLSLVGYGAYGIMILLPVILEAEEAIKWKLLQSNI